MLRVFHVAWRILPGILSQTYGLLNTDNKEVERKTKMIKKTRKLKAKPQGKEGEDGENNDDEVCKKLPKKPLTAYIIYFQEKKPNFVEKHPGTFPEYSGLNLSDLTKLIAK